MLELIMIRVMRDNIKELDQGIKTKEDDKLAD